MNRITCLFICLLLTGCAGQDTPDMQRAVILDATNNQIIATEFPGGSTVKFDGPAGKLEVIAPAPKASFVEDMAKGLSTALGPMMPILMIKAMADD